MNVYATLTALKSALNVTSTARDSLYLEHLAAASRRIEQHCGRVFYVSNAVRYFNAPSGDLAYLDDFCSLSALAMDSDLDGTFDGETWVEGTDWVSFPYNSFPKFGVEMHVNGDYGFVEQRRYIKATGIFGYGDGLSASPWDAKMITGTVASTDGTTLTLSADGVVQAGHTILIGTEQLYVESLGTLNAVVRRGVNGTTAAIHAAAAVSLAKYPVAVVRACVTLAISGLSREGKAGMKTERIGDYSYTLSDEGDEMKFLERALMGLGKLV
jgi:hypothetical protein